MPPPRYPLRSRQPPPTGHFPRWPTTPCPTAPTAGASRERPTTPILALTPQLATARRLALAWGVHPVPFEEVHDVTEMVEHAGSAAVSHGFAGPGDVLVVIGGLPFGTSGSTNLLHVARIPG